MRDRSRKSTLLILTTSIVFAASSGCDRRNDSRENERTSPPSNGQYWKAGPKCELEPDRISRHHKHPTERIISSNGRWIARTDAEKSQHRIDLYDIEEERHYILHHPSASVMLMDLSFSRDSKYLALIGSPLGINGISEIFVVTLDSMTISRLGREGYNFRYPIVLSDNMELLFYQAVVSSTFDARTIVEMANHENSAYYLATRKKDGGVRYLIHLSDHEKGLSFQGRAQFSATGTREKIPFPTKILYGKEPDTYYAYSSTAYEPGGGYSLDDIVRYSIRVRQSIPLVLEKKNVNQAIALERRDQQQLPRNYAFPDWDDGIVPICLEQAQIQ